MQSEKLSPTSAQKSVISEQPPLPPYLPRKNSKRNDIDFNDKIEIDSDNIETPPATRKLLNFSKTNVDKLQNQYPKVRDEEEILGDGQFDRFSSTRRTRRYRKPQDDDIEIVPDKQIARPTILKVKSYPPDFKESGEKEEDNTCGVPITTVTNVDNQVFGQHKKEVPIKNKIPILQSNYVRNSRLSSTLPHSFKNKLTSNLNNEKNECDFVPGEQRIMTTKSSIYPTKKETVFTHSNSSFIPEIKIRTLTPTKNKIEHDLHDEGFEETQSLISDSPSQTASSGHNYDTDNIDLPSPSTLISSSDSKQILFSRTDSSGSGDASGCDNKLVMPNKQSKILNKTKSETKVSLLPKRTGSVKLYGQQNIRFTNDVGGMNPNKIKRSSSMHRNINFKNDLMKCSSDSNELRNNTKASIPRFVKQNTTSKIKSSSPVNCKMETKTTIQRCPSKSSLKSSKSSLNSCTSVSTVKNIKSNPKLDNYTKVIKSLATNLHKSKTASPNMRPAKKPLTPVQTKQRNIDLETASRSSSSASSSESPIRRQSLLNLSTSFKENSTEQLNKCSINSSQNFMKPTASSSAKDMTDLKPKLIIRTPFK